VPLTLDLCFENELAFERFGTPLNVLLLLGTLTESGCAEHGRD
jgi:hypothetical protein